MIAVRDIAYVRYQAPDLDLMERFLADFGLLRFAREQETLYMRGYASPTYAHITEKGESSRGSGLGLLARSRADLDKLAAEFGTRVRANEEPCGGMVVTVTDPSGFRIDVLHGWEPMEPLIFRPPNAFNSATQRDRLGRTVRVGPGTSHAMRLGHVVLKVPDFDASFDFYTRVFGFKLSDGYHAEDPARKVLAFLHCGLGQEFVDHHTVALVAMGAPESGFDHSAFEVLDWDDLMVGNDCLRQSGYSHSWGVGRHVEGSQIFDYWRDPFGNKIEHWTDGDLVNDDYVSAYKPLREDGLAQWAPPLNPEFFS